MSDTDKHTANRMASHLMTSRQTVLPWAASAQRAATPGSKPIATSIKAAVPLIRQMPGRPA